MITSAHACMMNIIMTVVFEINMNIVLKIELNIVIHNNDKHVTGYEKTDHLLKFSRYGRARKVTIAKQLIPDLFWSRNGIFIP